MLTMRYLYGQLFLHKIKPQNKIQNSKRLFPMMGYGYSIILAKIYRKFYIWCETNIKLYKLRIMSPTKRN